MIFKVMRRGIEVHPENAEDEAYIEDTVGLTLDGDGVLLKRKNVTGMRALGYLTTVDTQKDLDRLKLIESAAYEIVDHWDDEDKHQLNYLIDEFRRNYRGPARHAGL